MRPILVLAMTAACLHCAIAEATRERAQAATRGDHRAFAAALARERHLRGRTGQANYDFDSKHPRSRGGKFADKPGAETAKRHRRKKPKRPDPRYAARQDFSNVTAPDGSALPEPFASWLAGYTIPPPGGKVLVDLNTTVAGDAQLLPDGGGVLIRGHGGDLGLGHAVLAHELGHAFDLTRMTDPARAKVLAILGQTRPWGAPGASNTGGYPNAPREQFADAYSFVATHAKQLASSDAWFNYVEREGNPNTGVAQLPHGLSIDYTQARRLRRLIFDVAAGHYGMP